MAPTDALPLSPLAESAIGDCMALSVEAGWNQTADDWALFMRHGTVFGLPGGDGRTVATGAVLPYPDHFAWISMVLVTACRRRERIGSRILETCCADIVRRDLVPVLDATPAGERVYRPLGFKPMFALSRWQGDIDNRAAPPAGIRAMTTADIPAIAAIDAAAFGAPRRFLLESLYRRAPQRAFVTDDLTGFVLARPGQRAMQIGPIVAAGEDAAAALLDAALGAATGPVFLDLIDRWDAVKRRLEQRSFTVQRPFLRMGLHRAAPFGDPDRFFVVAGPEFG
jgi:ribosomal protein S18 acetylase RimI-like enzyme